MPTKAYSAKTRAKRLLYQKLNLRMINPRERLVTSSVSDA